MVLVFSELWGAGGGAYATNPTFFGKLVNVCLEADVPRRPEDEIPRNTCGVEESKMAAQSQKQEEHTRFHMPSEPHLLSEKLQQYR